MDEETQAATIGAMGELGNSMVNYLITSDLNKENRKFAKEMAELQYQRDLEQWQRQNEYNSPASQMERFTAAGLNPRLIYGQGTPGNASSYVQYDAPKSEYKAPPPMNLGAMEAINVYQNTRMRQVEIDRIKKLNQILDEQKSNAVMQNIKTAMDIVYAFGEGSVNMPAPYDLDQQIAQKNRVEIEQEGNKTGWGYKDHQIDVMESNADLNRQRLLNEIQKTGISEAMLEKINTWLYEWETNRINLDKDSKIDRDLQDLFGDDASGIYGGLKSLIPLFRGILAR